MGSGSFFPGVIGIDIHTYAAPIISYITNSQFLMLSYNYFYFKSCKRKSCILFIVLVIILPIFTRLARMSVVISLVQFFSLIIFGDASAVRKIIFKNKKRRNWYSSPS